MIFSVFILLTPVLWWKQMEWSLCVWY